MLLDTLVDHYDPEGAETTPFWITKRGSGKPGGQTKRRQIHAPNQAMRDLHTLLLDGIRSVSEPLPYAIGGMPGGSPLKHALAHRDHRFFYVVDLYEAYPSVREEWLCELLAELRGQLWVGDERLTNFVRKYCLQPSGTGLMTGPPASPDLFNQVVARRLDHRLAAIAKQFKLTYTRYLDDLVFSHKRRPIGRRLQSMIKRAIREAGFKLNYQKIHACDLAKQPIRLCGIGVRLSGYRRDANWNLQPVTELFPPPELLSRLERRLAQFRRGAEVNPFEIYGLMSAVRAIDRYGPHRRRHIRIMSEFGNLKPQLKVAAAEWQRRQDLQSGYRRRRRRHRRDPRRR
jgi:hypothetical protein